MTNPFNSAVSVIKQGSSERAARALSHQTTFAKPRWQAFGLTLCLSIVSAFGVGVTSYYVANQSVVERVVQTRQDETLGSLILQKHLLLTLTLATSVTALLASAIWALLLTHHASLLRMETLRERDATRTQTHQRFANAPVGLALEQATLLKSVTNEAKRTQFLADFTARIRQSLSPQDIFSTSVDEVLAILETDRVLIYRFHPDGKRREITSQAVASGWIPAQEPPVTQLVQLENFQEYKTGTLWVAHDVDRENLTPERSKLLEQLQIKASIVAPILVGEQLVGLLCAHQCSGSRNWQQSEFYFLQQLAVQIGFAIEQVNLVEQVQAVSQQQQQQTEELQRQLFNLLEDVEQAAQGNLTVRAEVTEGEIGTVADFFNALIESLRDIVTQVKRVTTQVNTSLSNNEQAIVQLSSNALKQAQETTRTLESIEQMTCSIQQVAERAHHAAAVARNASETAQVGTQAMERTVEKISTLRDTVAQAANKVRRLGESSQQISKVVALINQIALQTNLLAINAGIESARAGEESQSFAAVANEVSELAARSAYATQEIEHIVETIQSETAQVVETMDLGTLQMSQGTELVEETKQSLSQILDVSRQIDQLVASISAATGSQVETSFAVTELMKDIAKTSEETSQSSHQISQSLQETVDIAQELQESVEVFNVDETEPPTRSDLN